MEAVRYKRPIARKTASEVLDRLEKQYPDAGPELNFSSRYELLIATILSAQCTDVRVNQVTARLFVNHGTPEEMLMLSVGQLEEMIKPCGLHTTKAPNILATSRQLVEEYEGCVPGDMEALVKLPGVGRKTANVVLSNGFGVPAIAVDTHVFRVSNRIGLAAAATVEQTERQLMTVLPKSRWSLGHHLLIFHGRRCCRARSPECEICCVQEFCRHYKQDSAYRKTTKAGIL